MSIFPTGTYDLFITHRWYYTDPWQQLVALLDGAAPGRWRNWSLPWHDTSIERATPKGRVQLERLLRGQIPNAAVVLLEADAASTSSGRAWLEVQMTVAAECGRPVIGVRGGLGHFPESLRRFTCEVVDREPAAIFAAADRQTAPADERVRLTA